VAKSLTKHGFDAAPIHGDLDQSLRTKTLDRFRAGELKILVASDVAARGLDVPSVSHVFNFDVPIHADDYVHRVGRTGRAGRSGKAFMLASPRDSKYVDVIEKLTGNKLNRRQMTDIEVREDKRPRRDERGGRGGKDRGRDRGKQRSHRPPDGKYHDQVANVEPAQSAVETSAPTPAIADAPAPEKHRQEKSGQDHRKEHRPDHRQENRSDNRQGQHQGNRQGDHQGNRQHNDKDRQGRQQRHNEQARQPEAVDKSQLPAFLFRPVPVKKLDPTK
jgi:superfamily II DNA/RNA helicase